MGKRRWWIAATAMSLPSIAAIVVAIYAEPLEARCLGACAAWAAGWVTMFCMAKTEAPDD